MTTGSTVRDLRAVVNTTGGGPQLIGLLESRTWSGVDYPPVKTAYTNVYVDTRKGKQRFRKVYVRPPKRARTQDHNYQMSGELKRTTEVAIYNPTILNDPPTTFSSASVGGDVSSITFPWTGNDDIVLLNKLRSKVAGSDFNVGVFLGEGHEALSMITNAAARIYEAGKLLKRGQFDRAASALVDGTGRRRKKISDSIADDLSSNWLALRYGWLPLLHDAEAGAQFLAHQFSVPVQQVVRASRTIPGTFSSTSPSNVVWNTSSIDFSKGQYGSCTVGKRLKYTVVEKDVVALSGLTDVASIAWELMPYSFVADWFIPIGGYLAARGLSQALTGFYVATYREKLDLRGFKSVNPSLAFANRGNDDARYSFTRLFRAVGTDIPVPLPTVRPLSEVPSWTRCANAVALLVGSRGAFAR